ncbi:bifunctional ADP-dependent NAD(P)H-hydrate dehydratase/NAD(P)H-hydrate epimerase [Sinorhizobium saheli]|uniref:Bifunctional NAD(P)H-hydrate repair enzyme n=1 Tax=Sinorhizobium saheli TaxID=36856 RepID=A0A178YCW6_SINSA|nr:bifunctional ADP-dependent NAD(P)H-hydrate dehydratase/NAD(P)H-hydrate epimerase [Sinorhizobium saheli]MQW86220.1 bifunctional ADP-dependent NAD(P)H-hydrate dehydratase/NAD(P)H-hydrate epimerase [Sinorhizobium saheli]OAP45319.1 bifunctional ADP-dependent (S)-NAD(P)H-hydrate dehydratase/NAD(P)H-hydrate epimerase [Sinorhizobium saheli]
MPDKLQDILVTPAEMAAIDRDAASSGIDSFSLMRSAGTSVSAAALRLFPAALRFVVLCGPGNNGGDGYVAAAALVESGAEVAVFSFGDPAMLKGDAARARDACALTPESVEAYRPRTGDVVIDALFGAGLARDLPEPLQAVIERVNESGIPVVAVDLPSGLDGRTGEVRGASFVAAHTVTFMAAKPGHVLMPGRSRCGTLEVADIGIPARLISARAGHLRVNTPASWKDHAAALDPATHKYRRGHLGVLSGGQAATGAARLSAAVGLRAGAGLVTLASPPDALAVNAAHLTAVMLKEVRNASDLAAWLKDKRLNAFVLGPGFGIGKKARDFALMLCDRALVLDADGMTSFSEGRAELFERIAQGGGDVVMTPHEGEFVRLFPEVAADARLSKIEKAAAAAKLSHAVIVLKGPDTVIADPSGRAVVNANAPPWLATAGSGDVLAGIVGAHLAQGMPAFEAAAAAVWRHGEAGTRAGRTATAETLVDHIPPLA